MNTLLQGDTAKLLKISFPNTEIQSYDWISTFNAWRKKYLNEPNSQRLLLASIFSTLYIRQYSSKLLAEIDINLLNNSQVAYYSFLRACDYYYSGELEKAIRYFSDCIMNDQLQDQLVKGFSYYNLARINTDSDNFDIADVYLSKSLSIFLEEMDWVRLSDCLHEVGRVNSLTGHEERGIDFLTMSGEICEKIGDLNGAAMSYHGIAVANYRLNNIVEAEKFLDKAGNIFSLTFDKQGSFLVHHLRGMLEAKNGSFDVAEKHYRKAIELEKEIDASLDLAHTMHNLADILISKGEYEEAKTLLNQSINIKMQYEDQEGIRNSKILLRTIQSIENLRYKLY
jgi:tetratricopeptide (TPR) repeat protein